MFQLHDGRVSNDYTRPVADIMSTKLGYFWYNERHQPTEQCWPPNPVSKDFQQASVAGVSFKPDLHLCELRACVTSDV